MLEKPQWTKGWSQEFKDISNKQIYVSLGDTYWEKFKWRTTAPAKQLFSSVCSQVLTGGLLLLLASRPGSSSTSVVVFKYPSNQKRGREGLFGLHFQVPVHCSGMSRMSRMSKHRFHSHRKGDKLKQSRPQPGQWCWPQWAGSSYTKVRNKKWR